MNPKKWLWVLVLPLAGAAAEIPPPIVPAGVGVNIHFIGGHEQDLDLISAAGFKMVRMDFAWGSIEAQRGQYNWSEYEQLLANLDKRGLRALFILDYSNPLYEEGVTSPDPLKQTPRKNTASPQHPESIEAFARWAAAAATHFHGRHVIWEIWNEPNGNFWSPKPDARQYTALALATCKAIRQAEPAATIIAPASAGFPWEYLQTFLDSGALEFLDGVSVHPYRDRQHPPETAAEDYKKLRQLIDERTPASRKNKIPILSGEWGYPTHNRGVSLETQAAFAARQQISNLLNDVPVSIWYDWKNDGADPNDNENNFGTVFPDLTPKPSYVAIRALTGELAGYRIERRIHLPNDKDYVLVFRTGEAAKLAAWTLAEPHSVTLDIDPGQTRILTGMRGDGQPFKVTGGSGHLPLELAASPLYVGLEGATVR